jgi:hypothetical protein
MGLLRSLLFDNLGLKLVALLLAFVVYLHVYTERPATMMLAFPIELTDLADSLAVSGPAPPAVHAELRGTGKSLIRLRVTEPRIKVSLANAERGVFERRLTLDDLPLIATDRLEVTRLAGPTIVRLDVDRRVERDVPVAPRIEAEHAEGATLAFASSDPPRVRVRGPARVIAGLDSLRLPMVPVDARRDTVRVDAGPIEVPQGCTVAPMIARVTVAFTHGAQPAAASPTK